MGRSVSVPSNARHVSYQHCHIPRYYCGECADTFDEASRRELLPGENGFASEEDEQSDTSCCPHCGAGDDDYYEQDQSEEFGDYLDHLTSCLREAYPSLSKDEIWLSNEDHALLSNDYAYFGVSEYCDLVAVWCAPKELEADAVGRQEGWLNQIETTFDKVVSRVFGEDLCKMGTMSNGVGVFRVKEQ